MFSLICIMREGAAYESVNGSLAHTTYALATAHSKKHRILLCPGLASNPTRPPQIDASDIPAHDILTAGFPCQSFSSAGNEEGLEGDRGILFFEVTRVLRGCRPRAFILENVPNMLRLEV